MNEMIEKDKKLPPKYERHKKKERFKLVEFGAKGLGGKIRASPAAVGSRQSAVFSMPQRGDSNSNWYSTLLRNTATFPEALKERGTTR